MNKHLSRFITITLVIFAFSILIRILAGEPIDYFYAYGFDSIKFIFGYLIGDSIIAIVITFFLWILDYRKKNKFK